MTRKVQRALGFAIVAGGAAVVGAQLAALILA
jgi:hypothetical protein